MRSLNSEELQFVSGGANPHLKSVTLNPGGVSGAGRSGTKNPNSTTITYKTTGKPA